MKLGQYCQRQRCRHAELKQFRQAFAGLSAIAGLSCLFSHCIYVRYECKQHLTAKKFPAKQQNSSTIPRHSSQNRILIFRKVGKQQICRTRIREDASNHGIIITDRYQEFSLEHHLTFPGLWSFSIISELLLDSSTTALVIFIDRHGLEV